MTHSFRFQRTGKTWGAFNEDGTFVRTFTDKEMLGWLRNAIGDDVAVAGWSNHGAATVARTLRITVEMEEA